MATLGTIKFLKPFPNEENPKQILKNDGYISLILYSAFYHSEGNFWQDIFGGVDKITLSTTVSFRRSNAQFQAQTIQDIREVKARKDHFLGINRYLALKIPSDSDGIEIKVNLVGVKKDNLENAIDLLNNKDFQEPLQIIPQKLGEVLSITKLVKKVLSGIEQDDYLEASWAGIISEKQIETPSHLNRLTEGHLILISSHDEDDEIDLSEIQKSKLAVEGNGLKYSGELLTKTNIVFSIIFEDRRGIDSQSNWNKKYIQALDKLDQLSIDMTTEQRTQILNESKEIWKEANILLNADDGYIQDEKREIKDLYFVKIHERYKEITERADIIFINEFLAGDFQETTYKEFDSKESLILNATEIANEYKFKLNEQKILNREITSIE